MGFFNPCLIATIKRENVIIAAFIKIHLIHPRLFRQKTRKGNFGWENYSIKTKI